MAKKMYEKARIAVDAVIFTIHDKKLKLLLHKREKEPYKKRQELPGGLLKQNETAEQTLKRKLKEIISYQNIFFQQFFTFTNPSRDPRERTVSIGFIALINEEKIENLKEWYDYPHLPELAFDHKEIIKKARTYLKKNVSSLIAKQFMPNEFALNKLQEAYEVIEGKKYDNRNFRKKLISSGIVIETNKIETNVSHRPAKLYKIIQA